MAYVPGFGNDIFISYSHLDDQAVPGTLGWVSDFHRRLKIEVEEALGAHVQIWRDPRIGPADDFARHLDRQVRGSATLLAILSPGYLNSAWCEWELEGFAGSRRIGDLLVDEKCRAIKIGKRPADAGSRRLRVLPDTGVLELFETDPASGRSYELSPESEKFNRLLSDLGSEIAIILRRMRCARSVYLGTASAFLLDQRERLKQELNGREFHVVDPPAGSPGDTREIVRAAVKESSVSILFYDLTDPSASPAAMLSANERDVAMDERGRQIVVVHGQPNAASQPWHELPGGGPGASNAEYLIDPPFSKLCHTVLQTLGAPAEPIREPAIAPQRADAPAESGRRERMVRIYLICDRQDHPLLEPNRARSLRDHLLRLGFEVKTPLAEDSEPAEFSRDNRAKLKLCDGVLLYWGTARQAWFDQRLGELTQARGWRHGRAFAAVGAYVSDPLNPVKQNYETREVDELIKQFEAFDVADAKLVRFVTRLEQQA